NTPSTHLPPIVQLSTFYAQDFAPIAAKFELDAGITVSERPDINSANGILGHVITDRNAKGSFDPEVPSVLSHNIYNRMVAGTTGSLSGAIGTVAGNTVEYWAPCIQYNDAAYADRNGILT